MVTLNLPGPLTCITCRGLGWQRAKGGHNPAQKASEYTGQWHESKRFSSWLNFLVRRTDTQTPACPVVHVQHDQGHPEHHLQMWVMQVSHQASPLTPSHPPSLYCLKLKHIFAKFCHVAYLPNGHIYANFKTLPFSNLGLLLLASCFIYFWVPSGTDTVERAEKLNCAGLPPALIDSDSYSHWDLKKPQQVTGISLCSEICIPLTLASGTM